MVLQDEMRDQRAAQQSAHRQGVGNVEHLSPRPASIMESLRVGHGTMTLRKVCWIRVRVSLQIASYQAPPTGMPQGSQVWCVCGCACRQYVTSAVHCATEGTWPAVFVFVGVLSLEGSGEDAWLAELAAKPAAGQCKS